MKRIIAALLILAANLTEAVGTRAEVPEPKAPELEYCLRLNVQISESNYVGDNHKGKRNVIPIVGGTFEAPANSRYDWLNNSLFLCRPDFTDAAPGIIVLDVWRVR